MLTQRCWCFSQESNVPPTPGKIGSAAATVSAFGRSWSATRTTTAETGATKWTAVRPNPHYSSVSLYSLKKADNHRRHLLVSNDSCRGAPHSICACSWALICNKLYTRDRRSILVVLQRVWENRVSFRKRIFFNSREFGMKNFDLIFLNLNFLNVNKYFIFKCKQ